LAYQEATKWAIPVARRYGATSKALHWSELTIDLDPNFSAIKSAALANKPALFVTAVSREELIPVTLDDAAGLLRSGLSDVNNTA